MSLVEPLDIGDQRAAAAPRTDPLMRRAGMRLHAPDGVTRALIVPDMPSRSVDNVRLLLPCCTAVFVGPRRSGGERHDSVLAGFEDVAERAAGTGGFVIAAGITRGSGGEPSALGGPKRG